MARRSRGAIAIGSWAVAACAASTRSSLWDELDDQTLMPSGLRPWVEVPVLDREQLKDLQLMLIEVLRELEALRSGGSLDSPTPLS